MASGWTKTLKGVPPVTQAIVDAWANETAKIPRSKQQKGYSNFLEGYIHEVEVKLDEDSSTLRALAYPSMRKNNPPYKLQVKVSATPVAIVSSKCECKAGNGHCSHAIGLLYLVCHYLKLGLSAVPPVQSKTSLPQTWHVPSRREGLTTATVQDLAISKVKPASQPPLKKRRVTEGILPQTYCPVQQPIPTAEFANVLVQELTRIGSDAQILKYLPHATNATTNSKFGVVFEGSPLSYQQRPEVNEENIINHPDQPTYPDFPLPTLSREHASVLGRHEMNMVMGLSVTVDTAMDTESQTRSQSLTKVWHDVRKNRLTSSVFKDIFVRRKDHDTLSQRLLKQKNIQTAAMKYGIEHEPEAAKLYANVTGNNVYACGFVINPSAPYLGTSPDRKVYDPDAQEKFGLLEIKCPDKEAFEQCPYLQKTDDTYKLKENHPYFIQMMGQMGLTGMPWCDFFVKCKTDYHMERVVFDPEYWQKIKSSLDTFFFDVHLTQLCAKTQ